MDIRLKKEKKRIKASRKEGLFFFFCNLPHDSAKEKAETPKENKESVSEQAGNRHRGSHKLSEVQWAGKVWTGEFQILELFRRENSELTGSQDSPS